MCQCVTLCHQQMVALLTFYFFYSAGKILLGACILLEFFSIFIVQPVNKKRRERVISSWMPTFDEATTLSTRRTKKPIIRVDRT